MLVLRQTRFTKQEDEKKEMTIPDLDYNVYSLFGARKMQSRMSLGVFQEFFFHSE